MLLPERERTVAAYPPTPGAATGEGRLHTPVRGDGLPVFLPPGMGGQGGVIQTEEPHQVPQGHLHQRGLRACQADPRKVGGKDLTYWHKSRHQGPPSPASPTTDSLVPILAQALVTEGVTGGQAPEARGLRNLPSRPPCHALSTATSTCARGGSGGGTEPRDGEVGRRHTPDLCGGPNHTPVPLVVNLCKSLNVTQSQE